MKTTLGHLRRADEDFRLIEPGDHVAVGVSGGKDSLLLLHALATYRKFQHKDFRLTAITVSMGLEPFDLTEVKALCQRLDVPYIIEETQIGEIVFSHRQEKNPCALCAKMRRGALVALCRKLGCNKLALGHHREDAIDTLLMSILHEGRFHTFHPKTTLEGVTVIRPLCYLPEKEAVHMQRKLALPVVKAPCPVNGDTERAAMRDLMRRLQQAYPDAPERILHALQHDESYHLWEKDKA